MRNLLLRPGQVIADGDSRERSLMRDQSQVNPGSGHNMRSLAGVNTLPQNNYGFLEEIREAFILKNKKILKIP